MTANTWSIEYLQLAFDRAGVPRNGYCLPPEGRALTWVLYKNEESRWQIYWSEKGMQDLEVFDNESDACKRFFEIVTGNQAFPSGVA